MKKDSVEFCYVPQLYYWPNDQVVFRCFFYKGSTEDQQLFQNTAKKASWIHFDKAAIFMIPTITKAKLDDLDQTAM